MSGNLKPVKSYLHTASSVPFTGMTLCDALDQAAKDSQDKDAFVFVSKSETKRITFKQLHHDVIKMAAGLLHLGLNPGDRVGIWLENRYEWILVLYATAYVKMTAVRFLTAYKKEHMEYAVKKTKVTTLVIGSSNQEDIAKELPTVNRIIHLDDCKTEGMYRFTDVLVSGTEEDARRVEELRKTVQQDDEAMINFTSGSTGMQKASVRSHRCFIENLYTSGRHVRKVIGDDIRYLCMTPFAHVGADIGIVMGVVWKYTVIALDLKSDASTIAEVIQRECVTFTMLMFRYLFDLINEPRCQGYDFSSIKYLASGGNMVPEKALERAREMVTPNIFNVYASTEGAWITFQTNSANPSSVGYPVDHQEIKIIDDKGKILPLATAGELCIRSPYLFLRYEGDREKTKESIDESGWFHTSDICRMDEDGCLQVVGRKQDVIIRGGLNIYPIEIERILIQHPMIKLAQVVPVPDDRMIQEICACIVLGEGQETTADDIMEFIRSRLRENTLPKYTLFFHSFPTSPTGKLDRKEIAKMAIGRLGL